MSLERSEDQPDEIAENGVLDEAVSVDPVGIPIATEQVAIVLPPLTEDDLSVDDDVVSRPARSFASRPSGFGIATGSVAATGCVATEPSRAVAERLPVEDAVPLSAKRLDDVANR